MQVLSVCSQQKPQPLQWQQGFLLLLKNSYLVLLITLIAEALFAVTALSVSNKWQHSFSSPLSLSADYFSTTQQQPMWPAIICCCCWLGQKCSAVQYNNKKQWLLQHSRLHWLWWCSAGLCRVVMFSCSRCPTLSENYQRRQVITAKKREKTAVVVEGRPVSPMVMSALIITTTAAADAAAVSDCGKSPRELVQLSSSSSLTAAGAR